MRFPQLRWLSLGCVLALMGCSVDMFSKSRPDGAISGREHYRAVRPECAGLKVERPELDSATFRSLIDCFGANGSIPEITALVHQASDRTIGQAVDLLNSTFLADPSVRADSRGIIQSLKRRSRWEPALAGFAPAFGDSERIRATVRLLSLGSRSPLVLKTVKNLDARGVSAGLELASRLVKTPAFAEVSRKMRESPLTAGERDRLLEILADFLQHSSPHASANLVLEDLLAGKSTSLWSYLFGEGDQILGATSRFSVLLHDFSGSEGLRRVSLLHRGFRNPIECWGGGRIFSDPWVNLEREMSLRAARGEGALLNFVGRFGPVTMLAIPDLCPIPEELYANYPGTMKLFAGRSGGEYLGMLTRIFKSGAGLSAGYFVGEWGVQLSEALTIVEAKPWFGDLVALLGEVDSDDRELLAGWTHALLRDRTAWTELMATWRKSDIAAVLADVGEVMGLAPMELASMLDSIRELFASASVHPWFEGWKRIAAESDSNVLESLASLKSFPEATAAIGRMADDGRLASMLSDILELLAGGGRAGENAAAIVEPEALITKAPRHRFTGADLKPLENRAPFDESLSACAKLDLRKPHREQWEVYQACVAGGGVDPKAFQGVQIAESWMLSNGERSESFLDSIFQSWIALPITLEDKREIVAMISGERPPLPAVTPGSIQEALEWFRGRMGTSGGTSETTQIFQILHRFQTDLRVGVATWQDFFTKIARAIEDARFVPIFRSLRSLVDPSTVGDRPIAKVPLPPAPETAGWVRDLECERDPRRAEARAAEIGREFNEAVLGWERPEGKLPLRWSAEMLRPRLRSISESLGSPTLRAGLYSWLAHLDPKTAAKWFADRASDPRLVAVMDPETKELRVRWMTSLDRLESVLVNANFTYLLNGNYGLKFIGKFAEAWGDEPRSRWPLEIQERYSGGKTPPKLSEVYDEVLAFVRWFEKFGGIPSVPSCVAKESSFAKAAFDDPWASAPDLVIPFAVKAKAFNLKQTLSVIHENLPGSGTAHADGMRLLRDLFWAVYSSAPAEDRSPARPERNPLRFLQILGDLGGLRSISRGLQSIEFASERLALEDAFAGMRLAVTEPAFDRLIAKFVHHPASLDRWVDATVKSPDFQIGTFAYGVLDALAVDRTLRVSPVLLRFVESVIGSSPSDPLPDAFIGDFLLEGGKPSVGPSRLRTWRLPNSSGRDPFSGLADFFENRLIDAIRSIPMRDVVRLLSRDSEFRHSVIQELGRWTKEEARQSDGDRARDLKLAPYFDLLLSTEHPQLRRSIGLWCGKSAGRYAYELSSRPDEALLMIDGLLQSGQSAIFSDFLESLLRELRD